MASSEMRMFVGEYSSRDKALVQQRLDKEIGTEIEHLAAGKAADYADYRCRVGRISGLKTALQWLTESGSEER